MATKPTKPVPIGRCKLVKVRLSFPKLFEPDRSTSTSALKFSANFLIQEEDPEYDANCAAAQAAFDAVYKETWPGKKIVLKDDRKAYRDGDKFVNQETGEVYAGYEGAMAITASRKAAKSDNPADSSHIRLRPPLWNRDKTPIEHDDGTLYGGCRVDAIVNFYSVTDLEKGGNGIFATIEGIRFRNDDTPFGNQAVGAEAFDDLDDEELDDESPI